MKVLWHDKDYKIPMYDWVKYHIFDDLTNHGVEIEYFDILEFSNPNDANEALLKRIRGNKYDVFVTAFNEYDIFPETIKEIKKIGIATLLICFDNLVVPYRHLNIAGYFDLVWLTSKETKWMFDKKGCNTIFLPYAANPNMARNTEGEMEGVGFVGSPYGSRANLLNRLTENCIDVFCHCKKKPLITEHKRVSQYSNGLNTGITSTFFSMMRFKEGRKVIEGALMNRMSAESKINKKSDYYHEENVVEPKDVYRLYGRYYLSLSSTTARNTGILKRPLYIVNLRSFEIPMACGIQFCRFNPELAEYFEEGKEIIFFYDNDDMIDKAIFYLRKDRDTDRCKIREAARARAVAEHSWYIRFKKAFAAMGFSI